MKRTISILLLLALVWNAGCYKTEISKPVNPSKNLYPQWFKDRGLEGKAIWDSVTGTVRFTANTTFGDDDDIEAFHWQVPVAVKTILIAPNVTVTGGFRVDHKMTIKGEDRATSIIFGTNTARWSLGPNGVNDSPNCNTTAGDDRAADCKKWQYSAIMANNLPASDTLYVSALTIKNARAYNITSINNPIKVDNVYLLEQRTNEGNNNCDGFGAGAGSSITNSTIEVTDDAIKLYKGMTVKNVTIRVRRNGAPFQLGWGSEPTSVHHIENVKVIGMDPQNRYNCGLFSWKSASANTIRTLNINGLKTQNFETAEIWGGSSWVPAPLFEIKSSASFVQVNGSNVNMHYKAATLPVSNGTIQVNICGSTQLNNVFNCGLGSAVTGNN